MPVTVLDPTTALIVVDLQAGLTGLPTVHPLGDIVANTAALADAFRAKGLPVVLVNVAGTAPGRTEQGDDARDLPDGFTDLLPALNQQSGDKTVTTYTWGAFHSTDLADHLDGLGVTQVLIAGVATSFGVEPTARQAHEHGRPRALRPAPRRAGPYAARRPPRRGRVGSSMSRPGPVFEDGRPRSGSSR
ncbi:cysteine hydrolase family protein [Streptomyces monashensis]|uniref:cysteine hydrolase family protein n=1 Tax=Streptomyces monashensis TaxID=1678012 RepID=UPI0009A1096B|nr:isochorismatase family cysteine hydrolase [Streptomyces monashensis]